MRLYTQDEFQADPMVASINPAELLTRIVAKQNLLLTEQEHSQAIEIVGKELKKLRI
jgi:hypothetical protein